MSPDYPTLYARSLERHLVLIRNLTGTIAEGGDLKAVVSRLVDALDALDVLGADPEADEVLRQAWLAAGGTDDDYPVVVFTTEEDGGESPVFVSAQPMSSTMRQAVAEAKQRPPARHFEWWGEDGRHFEWWDEDGGTDE